MRGRGARDSWITVPGASLSSSLCACAHGSSHHFMIVVVIVVRYANPF